MTAQLVYQKGLAHGLAGQLHDIGNTNIDSFAAEGAVAFGTFVNRGTAPETQCLLGASAVAIGAGAIGIAVRVQTENDYPAGAFAAGGYADEETVGVLRDGMIFAQFDAVGGTVGDAVTVDVNGMVVAAGTGTALTSGITATIEKPAVDCSQETTSVFVGVIKVNG